MRYKRSLSFFTILLSTFSIDAQWSTSGSNVYYNSGNVGIGTDSPESKLEVAGSGSNINIFQLSSFDSQTTTMSMVFHPRRNYLPNPASSITGILDYGLANEEAGSISFNTSHLGQLTEKMRIRYDGNVGIGTNVPTSKLEVAGSGASIDIVQLSSFDSQTSTMSMVFHPRKNYLPNPASSITGILDYGLANEEAGSISFNTSHVDQLTEKMRIRFDGNVGIGTINPVAKLEVAGNIHSQEVKVTIDAGTGPDYVFEEDYELTSLEEIEAFIKAEKHLPEVPSAKEMETNGVELGEMNMLLLKKIEELTLHVIELKKENQEQKKRIEKLEKK